MSMLPIIVIGYHYGAKWGILSGFAYGLIQLILGIGDLKGLEIYAVIGSIVFDFIVAFSVLGLGGMFKGKIKNSTVAFSLGALVCCFLRLVSHFISGVLFFGSFAEWYFSQEGFDAGLKILEKFSGFGLAVIYSAVYNISYMLPEIIFTVIAAAIIINIKPIKERISQ